MQITEARLELTLDKANRAPQRVRLRQGDAESTMVSAHITQGGSDVDLSGCTVMLVGTRPDQAYCEQQMTVSGSQASCVLESAWAGVSGLMRRVYVQIRQGGEVVASTEDVLLEVMPGADPQAGSADPYILRFEEAIDRANSISQTLENKLGAGELIGEKGEAATVKIGSVATLGPDEAAYVRNVGTDHEAVLDIGIPKGDSVAQDATIDGFETTVIVPLGLYLDADGDLCQL